MPPKRDLSSQTSQANDDVPPQFKNVGPVSVEGLHRYLRTLVGLVKRQA